MDSPQKLAFVIQANRLQGLIWQALLKSQSLAVILEPSRTDLVDCIRQIAEAGLTLPDVIILDTEINDLNPYEFCRWCRQSFPRIEIFLTRTHRGPIAETERRWAMQQGATGFLHGFHRETLMSAAADSMRLILASLDAPFLNEKALLSVLLNIRRQMSQSTPSKTTLSSTKAQDSFAAVPGHGTPLEKQRFNQGQSSPGGDLFNDISWVSDGLRALNDRPSSTNGASSNGRALPAVATLSDGSTSAITPEVAPSSNEAEAGGQSGKTRRYRGVTY